LPWRGSTETWTSPPSGEYLIAFSIRLTDERTHRLDRLTDDVARVDLLARHVQPAGVEVAREEDVVDDAREPVGLIGDDREQVPAGLLGERGGVTAAQRHRRAVDGGERRAQLV
jgi:hypothetical protein